MVLMSMCSSVLQINEASEDSAPMAGIKARSLLLLCLKNSFAFFVLFYTSLDIGCCVSSVSLTPSM